MGVLARFDHGVVGGARLLATLLLSFALSTATQAATPPPLSNPSATPEAHLGPAIKTLFRGAASVGAAGNANYVVPIEVPPGVNGMAPALSFNFNSTVEKGKLAAKNGLLGVGWFVAGLNSKIVRCDQTLAQDNAIHKVDYSANDRYCLNGHRLVAISGSYGADGTEYRLESDDFSRIISHGSAGSGPAYFSVERKSGITQFYGNTADSRIEAQGLVAVDRWLLNRVEDEQGNYYTHSYAEDNANGEYRPTRIDYTGNDGMGLAPFASVQLEYETRPDVQRRFIAGTQQQISQRLTHLRTYVGSTLVRNYMITYETSYVMGVSHLRTLSDACLSSASPCDESLALIWNPKGTSFKESIGRRSLNLSPNSQLHQLDMHHTGRQDFVVVEPQSTAQRVYRGGSSRVITSPVMSQGDDRFVDINADQLPDFTTKTTVGNQWSVSIAFNRGTGHGGGFRGYDATPLTFTATQGADDADEFVDVNGDHLPDFISVSGATHYVRLNQGGTGYGPEQSWTGFCLCGATNFGWHDLNGDGKLDFVKAVGATHTVSLSTGTGYLPPQTWTANGHDEGTWTDLNGDGLIDYVSIDSANYTTHHIALSTGTGYQLETWTTQTTWQKPLPVSNFRWFKDLNGDGKTDFVEFSGTVYPHLFISFSTGNGYINKKWSSPLDLTAFDDFRFENISGSSVPDLIGLRDDGTVRWSENLIIDSHPSSGSPKDGQLGKIYELSGHGAFIEFTYKQMTDTTDLIYRTSRPGAEHMPAYPRQSVLDGRFLVYQTKRSDGIGSIDSNLYNYFTMDRDLHGRGDLAFRYIGYWRDGGGREVTTFYEKDFPLTGLPKSISIEPYGPRVSYEEISYGVHGNPATGPVFPYVSQRVHQRYNVYSEPGDRVLLATTTTTNQTDPYGNITDTTVLIDDHVNNTSHQTQTLSTFTNDTTHWRIGQLTGRTVKNSLNGVNDPNLNTTQTFNYDSLTGLLTSTTRAPGEGAPLELTTSFTYDGYGNALTQAVSGPGITTRTSTQTYDGRGQFPVTLTNALGHQETRSYDDRFGVMLTQTGPNGLTTSWTYNVQGQLTQETRPDGTTTSVSLYRDDSNDNPNALYYVETLSTGAPPKRVFYDELHRQVRQRTQSFNGSYILQDNEYNGRGRVDRTSEPYFEGTSPAWNTPSYDLELGRVISMANADTAQSTTTVYERFTTTVTDAAGHSIITKRNALGQVIETQDDAGTISQFVYNQNGNRIEVKNAVGTALASNVTYTYDKLGRQLSQDDPDHGLYTYTYNALGQKTEEISPKLADAGQSITFQYDLLGRLTSRTEPEGTSTWTYDNTTAGNKGIGKVHSESQTGFSRTYSYGSSDYGRLTGVTTQIGANSYSTARSYDSLGRLDTLTYPASQAYPSGFQVQRTYNALGFMERVQNVGGSTVYYQLTDTDAAGRMTDQWLGDGSSLAQTYANHASRITEQHTTNGGITLQRLTYAYDSVGNMNTRSDLLNALTETFTYDNLDRLTQAKVGTATPKDYGYNLIGNLTQKTDVGTYDYLNTTLHAVTQITDGGTINGYSYDINGNLEQGDDLPTLTWASYNKPTHITQGAITYEFSYGTDKLRYKKVHTTGGTSTTTHYLGDSFEHGQTGANHEYRHVIRAGGQAVAVITDVNGTTNLKYLHRDHLGSVTAITDTAGTLIERLSYDPWGKRRSPTDWQTPVSSATDHRGYTGHEHLDDINLIHMNGRVYSPKLGRMLSPDPVTQSPDAGRNYNRYTYAFNNPLKYTDPSGYIFRVCAWTSSCNDNLDYNDATVGDVLYNSPWHVSASNAYALLVLAAALNTVRVCENSPHLAPDSCGHSGNLPNTEGAVTSVADPTSSDSNKPTTVVGSGNGRTISLELEAGLGKITEALEKYDVFSFFTQTFAKGEHTIDVVLNPDLVKRKTKFKNSQVLATAPNASTVTVSPELLNQSDGIIASVIGHELRHILDHKTGVIDGTARGRYESEWNAYAWQAVRARRFDLSPHEISDISLKNRKFAQCAQSDAAAAACKREGY